MSPAVSAVQPKGRPCVKCAGGKTQLLDELLKRIPAKCLDNLANHRSVYYEPFLGGGALFFALQPRKAFLGDDNPHLIRMYESIRDDVEGLIRQLKSPRYKNNETAYYKVRELAFMRRETAAADFIYLNKTGFNGLFRVNSDGRFNVPFGKAQEPEVVRRGDPSAVRARSAQHPPLVAGLREDHLHGAAWRRRLSRSAVLANLGDGRLPWLHEDRCAALPRRRPTVGHSWQRHSRAQL